MIANGRCTIETTEFREEDDCVEIFDKATTLTRTRWIRTGAECVKEANAYARGPGETVIRPDEAGCAAMEIPLRP
jgi:hypothetical protein